MSGDLSELAQFLVEAKRRTYAGLDDDATVVAPLLLGSKQLAYRAGPYAYRDIYFGMGFFVGQETVTENDRPIWSMCYSGGVRTEGTENVSLPALYKFLRTALLAASSETPFRGPASLLDGDFSYVNTVTGTLERFHGVEDIRHCNAPVYKLRYSGGILR